jgi:type II secretory pathway pseudopilin PulG
MNNNEISSYSRKRRSGFTVAELILGLSVMAIVLAAAATLAFAMGSANSVTSKMSERQAHLRFANMRIGELIRTSRLVFEYEDQDDVLVFWVEDKNNNGKINGDEVAFLYAGNHSVEDNNPTSVEIVEFPGQAMRVPEFGSLNNIDVSKLYDNTEERVTELIADCSNVTVSLDVSGKFVTVEFDLKDSGSTKTYQICGVVRAMAGFDWTGYFEYGDDDL